MPAVKTQMGRPKSWTNSGRLYVRFKNAATFSWVVPNSGLCITTSRANCTVMNPPCTGILLFFSRFAETSSPLSCCCCWHLCVAFWRLHNSKFDAQPLQSLQKGWNRPYFFGPSALFSISGGFHVLLIGKSNPNSLLLWHRSAVVAWQLYRFEQTFDICECPCSIRRFLRFLNKQLGPMVESPNKRKRLPPGAWLLFSLEQINDVSKA
mmetsp:Transcript_45006/g.108843  ORF Transcript_45006/g.108843 Transcript_45006/m.108843 type:complete len:208 (-) Transcript_45006:373-996(-)